MPDRLNILFLCNHNANRSQMAEAWTDHLRGREFAASSAGIEPNAVDPRSIRVMGEAGVDISSHRSKGVEDLGERKFDYVVTLCSGAAENCPYFPAKTRVVHRSFDNPPAMAAAEQTEAGKLGQYRRIRDEIRAFVEAMPGSLE